MIIIFTRRVTKVIIVALTICVLDRFSHSEAGTINASYTAPNVNYLALFVGVDQKFYERAGLDIRPIRIRGVSTALQALIGGDISFVLAGIAAGMLAIDRGAKITAVMGLINEPQYEIFAAPEIRSLKDLRGKIVATGGPGSTPDFVIRMALSSVGLSDKEVDLRPVPGDDNRFTALGSKAVSATPLVPPLTSQAAKMGFRRLVRLKELIKNYQAEVVFVRTAMFDDDPSTVKKFIQATQHAIHFIKENKQQSIRILMKYSKSDFESAEAAYSEIAPGMPNDGQIDVQGVQELQNYHIKSGRLKGQIPPLNSYFDMRLIKRN